MAAVAGTDPGRRASESLSSLVLRFPQGTSGVGFNTKGLCCVRYQSITKNLVLAPVHSDQGAWMDRDGSCTGHAPSRCLRWKAPPFPLSRVQGGWERRTSEAGPGRVAPSDRRNAGYAAWICKPRRSIGPPSPSLARRPASLQVLVSLSVCCYCCCLAEEGAATGTRCRDAPQSQWRDRLKIRSQWAPGPPGAGRSGTEGAAAQASFVTR